MSSNRIPVKSLTDCQTWQIPTVDDESRVIPSAEREERKRREDEERRKSEVVGEEIESPFGDGPLTAEKLRAIAETAQQEGYAEGYQRGFEEGKNKGHKEGLQKALDEGKEIIEKQEKRLTQLIDNLIDPFQSNSNALENLLLTTVTQLVQSIVQRELMTDSGQIITFVQQAINALPAGSDNLQIFLNPDDIVLLENFKTARHTNWQLHSDPTLLPGGCRVETKESVVDFSVEERLRVLMQQFANGELASGQPEEE